MIADDTSGMRSLLPLPHDGSPEAGREYLAAYDRAGRLVTIEERRRLLATIRDHSRAHGDAHLAVESVYLLLRNARDELYIVRRGDKPENPHLWDKSVGGHVAAGETHAEALLREADEEIGVTLLLTTREASAAVLDQLDTTRVAVAWAVDRDPWLRSLRVVRDGAPWVKRSRTVVYVGRYDGPVTFKDGEAEELRLVPRDAFPTLFAAQRETFTADMGTFLERWWHHV